MAERSRWDATEMARLVKSGVAKPSELALRAIQRVEALNPTLNAVVTPMFEQAMSDAQALDKLPRGAYPPDAPFAGVPTLVKDLRDVVGSPTWRGSRFALDEACVASMDSEIVQRLRRAGLILIGKTNVCELGLLPTTEPDAFGPTRNPWDPERTVGGSSGGAAAAVAAGMVPMAHANDGGGSIRIPASCAGLFGFKPSRGRSPNAGPFGLTSELAVTLSVRDAAALLDAIHGPELASPFWAPAPLRPFADVVQEAQREATDGAIAASPLRIAWSDRTLNGDPLHRDCAAAVRDAVRLCEALGHRVEEAAPAIDAQGARDAFMALWAVGCAASIEAWAKRLQKPPEPRHFEPLTWALRELGLRQFSVQLLAAQDQLRRVALRMARFFQQYDVWLTPTLAEPPPLLGAFDSDPDNPLATLERTNAFVPFTPIMNATGQPAFSAPLYWNEAGLPIGVHFSAWTGNDAALFRLAAHLEQVRPWIDRQPGLAAEKAVTEPEGEPRP